MRSEWVPFSAGALVTGVMAIMLGQLLNPGGSGNSPTEQMIVAGKHPDQWLAMSVLFFGGAAAMVLGLPCVMSLFTGHRGRVVGMLGVMVFAVGCLGVAAIAALMLMFRALTLASLEVGVLPDADVMLVNMSLEDPGLTVMLGVWGYGFLLGILLIAVGLLRAQVAPRWVPGLMLAFLALQLGLPFLAEGADTVARMGSTTALLLLTAWFTGIATTATHPSRGGLLDRAAA